MTAEPFRLQTLLERLVGADVRFVLVGGLAVGAWGYVRGTKDVDVVPDPEKENLEALAELLRELDGKVEVDERPLTADAISIFLRTGDRTLVATELGPVDVLQGLPQIPSFATLDAQATDDLEALEAAQQSEDRGS